MYKQQKLHVENVPITKRTRGNSAFPLVLLLHVKYGHFRQDCLYISPPCLNPLGCYSLNLVSRHFFLLLSVFFQLINNHKRSYHIFCSWNRIIQPIACNHLVLLLCTFGLKSRLIPVHAKDRARLLRLKYYLFLCVFFLIIIIQESRYVW